MKRMPFRSAAAATKGLDSAVEDGLGALRRADRERIACADPRRIAGSVDIDTTLRESHPSDPRWDYAVGVVGGPGTSDRVHWIEVHPANSRHVDEVLAKLQWLRRWLVEVDSPLRELAVTFVWVASGAVALPKHSPQRKRVAAAGLHFAGSHHTLPVE